MGQPMATYFRMRDIIREYITQLFKRFYKLETPDTPFPESPIDIRIEL